MVILNHYGTFAAFDSLGATILLFDVAKFFDFRLPKVFCGGGVRLSCAVEVVR